MKPVPSKPPAKVRQWRVSIIGKRLEYLGHVAATDREAAQAAAAEAFKLNEEQCRRVIVQEVV